MSDETKTLRQQRVDAVQVAGAAGAVVGVVIDVLMGRADWSLFGFAAAPVGLGLAAALWRASLYG
jgi:hypothetical protein